MVLTLNCCYHTITTIFRKQLKKYQAALKKNVAPRQKWAQGKSSDEKGGLQNSTCCKAPRTELWGTHETSPSYASKVFTRVPGTERENRTVSEMAGLSPGFLTAPTRLGAQVQGTGLLHKLLHVARNTRRAARGGQELGARGGSHQKPSRQGQVATVGSDRDRVPALLIRSCGPQSRSSPYHGLKVY